MAIQLKNLLLDAEDGSFTINLPDGTTSTKQFRQRSFTYGDNANTDPPLIVKDFNGNPLPGVEDSTTNPTLELVGEVTDNFVRGGAVTLAQRAVTDVARLGKVLISPNGLAWSATQLALAKTNPRNLVSPRNRLTLPINTLATAGTGAAGVRFRKDGLIDTNFESGFNYDFSKGGNKYESAIRDVLNLAEDGKLVNDTLFGVYDKINNSGGFLNREDIIKSYSGGAHSIFGIGTTEIKRYKSNPFNDIGDNGGYLPLFKNDFFELRQGPSSSELFQDYRDLEVDPNAKDHLKLGPSVSSKSRNILYKLGDPGVKIDESGERAYSVKVNSAIDILSAHKVFPRENLVAENIPKDYIKFRIAVVDTDNPLNDNVILFRAFLDSLSDNYTGNWNSYKYNGRAEEFYTYEGFNRGINFGFKIHAQTRSEQRPLWEKLNYLVAQTAPEYKNRRMRGVFSRLTIGDWISEIPGFFTSVNLSWQTSYPWEIKLDNDLDSDVDQYPHILDVSCNFQPIHDFAPSNSISTPFIFKGGTIAENTEIAKPTLEEKPAPTDL